MKSFQSVHFNGVFRDYQKGVIERTSKHLKDGKIHIVAAPGSGKTVLGLELIRALGSPALVFSPSVTIRRQWGERFEEKFLPQGESVDGYVSYDLKNPSLITSVTYQALHAAVTKQQLSSESESESESDEDETERESKEDFADFDIYSLLGRSGIKTICLDEAHHLKSEWQKALEAFISAVQGDVKIISLTATPPYDSTPAEWSRYISLCGEIDEEIFVPQLIAQKNLCPHQDFVFFSYPTEDENRLIREYKIKGVRTSQEILQSPLLPKLIFSCISEKASDRSEELILDNMAGFSSLFSCAEYVGLSIPKNLLRAAYGSEKKPEYNIYTAETAFNFVLGNPEIFSRPLCEELRQTLAENGLIDRKKVCLASNEKLDKQLVSSVGKLESIDRIVKSEGENLGEKLRMLVLTDYIKRDLLKLLGTDETIGAMGAVPVFESIRRSCGGVKLALLSGTLVIVPDASADEIGEIAFSMQMRCTSRHIENTSHSELTVSGSNKNKVSLLTEAFQRGLFNVLVGTKSLLGEGWDSPCINSLILASFVGSFMLSNQMRGRAIRTDRNDAEKVSNIWHLTTVEPAVKGKDESEQMLFDRVLRNSSSLPGNDFATLKRRFDCFLAPAYHSDIIESGMDRIDILVPPFDKAGIDRINAQMLVLASDRKGTNKRWFDSLHGKICPEILDVVEIKKPVSPKRYAAKNAVLCVLFAILTAGSTVTRAKVGEGFINSLLSFALLAAAAVFGILLLRALLRLIRCSTPKRTVSALSKCVLKALNKNGLLESRNARAAVKNDVRGKSICCMLTNASVHDKKVFSACMSEILRAPDDPRYVLVGRGLFGPNHYLSYACPAVLGTKKETVAPLVHALKSSAGKFEPCYTHNPAGHRELLQCRKKSYINASESLVRSKKIVVC